MATSGVFAMSVEDQAKLLAKYVAKKEEVAQRAREYREKNKEKCNKWSERARVRSTILVAKAKAAGLTVTETEVNEELARLTAKRVGYSRQG